MTDMDLESLQQVAIRVTIDDARLLKQTIYLPNPVPKERIEEIVRKHMYNMGRELLREGDTPTTAFKGIVIAGNRTEYYSWIWKGVRSADKYPLITDPDQLLGMRGDGLPCYLIGSYKANDLFNSDVEKLILLRGFVLQWERA